MAMLRRSVDLDVSERRHDIAIRVPCKKMKKRRELDALVAKSQKSLSAVYKSGGYPPSPHGPLLRDDSDSCSDLEGYPSVGSPKHQSACCKSSRSGMWVPAWLFLIVLIGTIVSASLLWLHIGLKQDFILLRNHLVKVDAENKHIPESLREMEQRLAHMQVNQSQVEDLVGQLSSQLEGISKHLQIVNGSAEELRLEISNAINKQMPSHFEKFNTSLVELQARITRVSKDLVSTNEQLSSLNNKQKEMGAVISLHDASIATIEDAITGNNTTSVLSRGFNSTVQSLIKKAQADIESSIQKAQSEIHARMSSSIKDSIKQMRRELSSAKPIEPKSVPLIASNTDHPKNDNNTNDNNNNNYDSSGSVRRRVVEADGSLTQANVSASSSNTSDTPTGSSTIALEANVTTRSPTSALSTLT